MAARWGWWAGAALAGGGVAGWAVATARTRTILPPTSVPCTPMTMACLLQYNMGALPVPDQLAWIPAQWSARVVQASGLSLYALTHHYYGYYGLSFVTAQEAGAYLMALGIDPVPSAIYEALAAASTSTGVPLPLLLSVAFTESSFLQYGQVPNSGCVPGHCTVGNTGVANGGPVGLMQVTAIACAQVGASYAAAITSPQANALAGAQYLAYLARSHGLSPTSTNYGAWQALIATSYGEGAQAATTVQQAADPTWVRQQTPTAAVVKQTQRLTEAPPPPPAAVPPQVTCRVVTLSVNGRPVRVEACSNGTWKVL